MPRRQRRHIKVIHSQKVPRQTIGQEPSHSTDEHYLDSFEYIGKGDETLPETVLHQVSLKKLKLVRSQPPQLPTECPQLDELILTGLQLSELPPHYLSAIKTYSNLQTLFLSYNKFTEMPAIINELEILKSATLKFNLISSFELTSSSLCELDLSRNEVSELPEIPETLQVLRLDFNNIPYITRSYPKLKTLSLNLVHAEMFLTDLFFPHLENLDLSRNRFSDFPDFRTSTPTLLTLDISDNPISAMPSLPDSLHVFSSRRNKIRKFPHELCSLQHIRIIDLETNRIKSIPPLPPSLEVLNLHENRITEFAPSHLPNLTVCTLYSNQLASLPPITGHQITELLASQNRFTSIDVAFLSPTLVSIDLSKNQLTAVPDAVFELPNLKMLYLFSNQITELPESLTNSHLQHLNISENPIGALPALPLDLVELYIDGCQFTALPDIRSCSRCLIVDASRNQISAIDSLPPQIRILIVAMNCITKLPPTLPEFLRVIDLSMNKLTSFPSYWTAHLEDIDISFNDIIALPRFNLPNLKVLKMSHNPQLAGLVSQLHVGHTLDISFTKLRLRGEPICREYFVSKQKQVLGKHANYIHPAENYAYAEMQGVRPTMEDSIIIRPNVEPGIDMYGVLDGHAGRKTAAFAAYHIRVVALQMSLEMKCRSLKALLAEVSKHVAKKKFVDGATCAVCLVSQKKIITGHIGDSRIIIITEDGTVRAATNDHKPIVRAEYERIRDTGGSVENNRVAGLLSPSRAIGDINCPGISSVAEVHSHKIKTTDRWAIIACDGVFDVMSNDDVGQIAKTATSCYDLAYKIRSCSFGRQSTDNISVIVVDLKK